MSRFSFEDMLDLKGNTAVYLLYAHARIASIIRKVGVDVDSLSTSAGVHPKHRFEVSEVIP